MATKPTKYDNDDDDDDGDDDWYLSFNQKAVMQTFASGCFFSQKKYLYPIYLKKEDIF